MPREYPNISPARGVLVSLVGLLLILYSTERMATSIEDKAAFLNILIQVSSVMVGFTSLISVFLIQSSLQNERDAASRYLLLVLEFKKLGYSGGKPEKGANYPANISFIKKMKRLMGSYRREQERQRRLLEWEKSLMIEYVMVFVCAIALSVLVGMGLWEWIWLPLGLTAFGFLYFPITAATFIHHSFPRRARQEFMLKIEEPRSERS